MSRYNGPPVYPDAGEPRSDDKRRADRDSYPSLVKGDGVVAYCRERWGVEVNPFLVKRAAESGKLPYSIISARRCFAPADVDAWLLSLRKSVPA